MAEHDLTDDQWAEAYRYLLSRLDQRGYRDVVATIEAAASAPVSEEPSPEENERIAKIVKGEVSKRILRRRRPAEVFAAAVGVLHTRLVEVPALAEALALRLKRSLEGIEFRVDGEHELASAQQQPVSLARLGVDTKESEALRAAFKSIGVDAGEMRYQHDGNAR